MTLLKLIYVNKSSIITISDVFCVKDILITRHHEKTFERG